DLTRLMSAMGGKRTFSRSRFIFSRWSGAARSFKLLTPGPTEAAMTNISAQAPQPVRRCAIYARKSQEPGFAQFMTSLEAQKEICSAYIKSQEHRGWILFDKLYVDSAQSAGTLDRPALQELLADIEAGLLDIVV